MSNQKPLPTLYMAGGVDTEQGWWREKGLVRSPRNGDERVRPGGQEEGEMDRSSAVLPALGLLEGLLVLPTNLSTRVTSGELWCPSSSGSQLISSLNNPWGSHAQFLRGRDHVSILIFP